MQVILNEDYPGLGFLGDVVNVKQGFARNYLFPKKIAIPSSAESLKLFEHRKRQLHVKKLQRQKDAEVLKQKIDSVKITIEHAATPENKLFGSVTHGDIHAKLVEAGVDVNRKLIRLEAPVRSIGEHKIEIKLHQDVSAYVTLVVEKKEEIRAEAPVKKAKPAKKAPKHQEETTEENQAAVELPEEAKADNDNA